MIVRERANASVSPRKGPEWPPKSPLDALLSSPSGRQKYQRRREGRSISPSPVKRPFPPSKDNDHPMSVASSDDEDDEDEETLQLKLKAIEAKLKLKKLQQAKAKRTAGPAAEDDPFTTASRPSTSAGSRDKALRPRPESAREAIQVPVSPKTDRRDPAAPRSPARVLLGIDKGLKAHNVSLKRAASAAGQSYSTSRAQGVQLGRSSSQRAPDTSRDPILSKPKSFSERISESRLADREKHEKAERIQNSRSRGFGLTHEARPLLSRAGSSTSDTPAPTTTTVPSTDYVRVSKATVLESIRSRVPDQANEPIAQESGSSLEPFSGVHLSKRLAPHTDLTRAFANKALYTLPKLLKTVKAPHYDAPDVEGDYVVLGIVASKSTPRDHQNGPKTTTTADPDDSGKHKFMALRLTDLKWEVDLFLFDTAFARFWKLVPGTVVALLNPGIMPPRRGREHTGAFALKLASSEDTVVEIGMARDLGFCKSVKKDGQECGSWVNKKKTEFCEFHVNVQIEKARASRMEVNGMGRFGSRAGSPGAGQKRWINSRPVSNSEKVAQGLLPAGGREFDFETKESYYVVPGRPGRSAAKLLDAEDFGVNAFSRGCSKEDLLKKRRKEREKELDLADKLGKIGGKAGGEYMRLKQGPASSADTSAGGPSAVDVRSVQEKAHDVAVQGLFDRTAGDVTLSPVKRKRGTGGGGSSAPVGWGGAFKHGLLLSPKKAQASKQTLDEASEAGSLSPSKKKARFFLDSKGLREPGRDSLGVVAREENHNDDDDDDDDLDIIR